MASLVTMLWLMPFKILTVTDSRQSGKPVSTWVLVWLVWAMPLTPI